jgi:hypothetical protein
VGLFDFFGRRRQRESAVPDAPSTQVPPVGQPEQPQEVVGQRVADTSTTGGLDLSSLGGLAGLGEMVQQAAAQGNVEVDQSSQTIDLRGTDLREEMVEIMKRHGIDPDSGAVPGSQIDASSMPQMQAEMLEALKRHGLDV